MFKTFRLVLSFILIVALVLPGDAYAARKKKRVRSYRVDANAALLWDVTANRRLYEKNSNMRVFPASTTKVMTAILVLEKLSLNDYVTVSSRATDVPQTKLDLKPGEQYRVRDLMYGILLKSANDAAIVLAEAVAGSQEEFVRMMNERARQLGATHTKFANAHGLPSETSQFTTAHDMALIFNAALRNPFFKEAITFKYRILYSKDGRRHFLKSHNKALFLSWGRNIYGKTGYTNQAQSCFVGYVPKGGHTVLISVFSSQRRWRDIKFIVERYGRIDL